MSAINPTIEFFEGTNLNVLRTIVNAYIENLGSQTVVSLELSVVRNSNIQRVYTIMLTYKKTTL